MNATFRRATYHEDTQKATDMVIGLPVVTVDHIDIAMRVRNPESASRFMDQITLTCHRESGAPCEWNKMVLGDYGRLFFYGIATNRDPSIGEILPWFLIDMQKARPYLRSSRYWKRYGPNRDVPGKRCWFHAFRPNIEFPYAIIAQGKVAEETEPPPPQMTLF